MSQTLMHIGRLFNHSAHELYYLLLFSLLMFVVAENDFLQLRHSTSYGKVG